MSDNLQNRDKIRFFEYSQDFQGFNSKEDSFFSDTVMGSWGIRALRMIIKATYKMPEKAINLLFLTVVYYYLSKMKQAHLKGQVPVTLWSWTPQLSQQQETHEHHEDMESPMFFLTCQLWLEQFWNTNLNSWMNQKGKMQNPKHTSYPLHPYAFNNYLVPWRRNRPFLLITV